MMVEKTNDEKKKKLVNYIVKTCQVIGIVCKLISIYIMVKEYKDNKSDEE